MLKDSVSGAPLALWLSLHLCSDFLSAREMNEKGFRPQSCYQSLRSISHNVSAWKKLCLVWLWWQEVGGPCLYNRNKAEVCSQVHSCEMPPTKVGELSILAAWVRGGLTWSFIVRLFKACIFQIKQYTLSNVTFPVRPSLTSLVKTNPPPC